MNFIKYVVFCFVFFVASIVFSQEFPPVSIYYADDYGAENQNWQISQADNGFIYVANNKGLLEFNGASWKLYETPNETIMRSVKAFEGKIYTGFYMDFGFWQKNKKGLLEFTSIVKDLKVKMLEDEQIWNIVEIDGWIVFKSLQRIYLYNLSAKKIKLINVENKINKLSKVNNIIYFQANGKGLFKIENGEPSLISDNNILKKNILVNIFDKDGKLYFITQNKGVFYLQNNEVIKWNIASNDLLSEKKIYSAQQLNDKSIALGTISNGLILLHPDGSLKYELNQSSALNNNTVLSVFEDKANNVWLGLDNGIDCVNNNSAFTMFNGKSDFLGTIYTSIVFKNKIYLGTNQGLFYKEINSKKPFSFIEGSQGQVWSLSIINDTLFCGHDSGTFIFKNNQFKNIFEDQGTWVIMQLDEKTILQGCYDGLYILNKDNNTWKLAHKIEGFDTSSKFVVQVDKKRFFVNHEYKGVFKITLDNDLKKVVEIEKEKSLEKGIHSSIINYKEKVLYASKNGVFVYHKELDNFSKDSLYSSLVSKDAFISAKLVYNASDDKLWFFSKDHIKYLSPGKLSNKPSIYKIAISESMPKAASGYENIMHLDNEIYLIGTSNGYMKIDLNSLEKEKDYNVYINQIKNFKTDAPKKNLDLDKEIELDFITNNLQFFYSVPNFKKTITTKYQYKLDGINKQWSTPSKTNSVLFENLPYGSYKFHVRAIIGEKISVNIASYSFKINRPWYLSNLLITVYVLLSLFAFYSVHIASKRYYKKQREDLLLKAKKEAEIKELASSQEIIKLNNERLRNDIDNKNKELATSTMNMIKKNELLSNIKMELMNGGDRHVAKVIKIIDKNLNNTDDWKMFQEAFNNADQNFIDKVKSKHPNLTPNDLRLCAYLRLNLSSKEIAPLLNISPRSVEVKRYRLRKKMDLPHNANLTNYILEI